MTYGETSTGWNGKSFDLIGSDIRERLRARIDPNLTLDAEDPLGSIVDVTSDELALAWEALGYYRNQFDPDNAENALAVAIAKLSGTTRRQATRGTATCSVTLGAGLTFLPGTLIAHVAGEPDNRWVNRDTITSTTAGVYTNKAFISETAGVYPAAINTITKIASSVSGWTAITNTAAATSGLALETIPELMVRRELELGPRGAGTIQGMHNAVSAVSGILSVSVAANDTLAVVGYLQPGQVEVVIWDGTSPAASNDAIAQAIWDNKSAGAVLYGATTGNATDVYGAVKAVAFSRAAYVNAYASATIVKVPGTDTVSLTAQIKALMLARWPQTVGSAVYASKLSPAELPGVQSVTQTRVDTAPSPAQTSLPAVSNSIYLLTESNITVSVT